MCWREQLDGQLKVSRVYLIGRSFPSSNTSWLSMSTRMETDCQCLLYPKARCILGHDQNTCLCCDTTHAPVRTRLRSSIIGADCSYVWVWICAATWVFACVSSTACIDVMSSCLARGLQWWLGSRPAPYLSVRALSVAKCAHVLPKRAVRDTDRLVVSDGPTHLQLTGEKVRSTSQLLRFRWDWNATLDFTQLNVRLRANIFAYRVLQLHSERHF